MIAAAAERQASLQIAHGPTNLSSRRAPSRRDRDPALSCFAPLGARRPGRPSLPCALRRKRRRLRGLSLARRRSYAARRKSPHASFYAGGREISDGAGAQAAPFAASNPPLLPGDRPHSTLSLTHRLLQRWPRSVPAADRAVSLYRLIADPVRDTLSDPSRSRSRRCVSS
jgi:hypothetical protein